MSLKLFLLLFSLAVVSGCIAGEKEVNTMEKITVSAEAFREGETIPAEYTCDGKDVSPSLSWKGIPANAKSIALIMDDPDAPGGTFVHWVLFNIPANTQKLPKGIPGNQTLGDGSRHGATDFGRVSYGGPCPPRGTHRYYFKMYALDTMLDLKPGASKKQLENAMKGHILAQGELMGKYER
ncbi:MAG: YbhB/YbcL family Raf kinase inhibitor-like protein [Candidatus Methanoperedens sp.]|nr:YbhB/YbcL family Raf kinase inhibitor-like protein [Candidatus Methanoperedens sp.]